MSAPSGYVDVTPDDGFLQGNSRPLKFSVFDEGGDGVAGEAANITLYIVEPSGSITIDSNDLTDNGDGSYEYIHEFDEAGWNFVDFLYVSGKVKIRSGFMILVDTRETAAAQPA